MHTPSTNNLTKLPAGFRAKAAAILQRCFGSNGADTQPQGKLIPQTQEQLTWSVESDWATVEAKAKTSGGKLPNKYTFVGVPLPPGTTTRGILVTGGMGSGKTVAILDLADQVAAAGETMIVYDLTDEYDEYAKHYYRDGQDVIFSPFDSRFPGWNLFVDIEHDAEFDQFAVALLAGSGATDFRAEASTVLGCVLRKLSEEGRRTHEALYDVVFELGPAGLCSWLLGTPAESLLDPKSPATSSVLSVVQEAVHVLRYVPSGEFSLKAFIRQASDRRLFISGAPLPAAVKPLNTLVLTVLYAAVLSGAPVREDQYWFLLDELRSIGHLPVLPAAVVAAGSYGAVTVLGVQGVAQIEEMFGQEASTLLSNLGHQLILRPSDEDAHPVYARLLACTGSAERSAVLACEIKMLPDCAGYLQLAGSFDLARVDYNLYSS